MNCDFFSRTHFLTQFGNDNNESYLISTESQARGETNDDDYYGGVKLYCHI